MKANAPEKVYLYPSDRAGEEYEDEWGDKPWGEDCVEYTRKDAFIEKTRECLMEYEFNDSPTIADRRKRAEDFIKLLESEL